MFFTPRPELMVSALEGFKVQDVASPLCSEQEIDVVLAAWVEVNIIFIVSMIESVSVLRREFFSVRLDAKAKVPLSDLNMEFFPPTIDVEVIESLKPLIHFFASDPATVREPLRL
jgi:hypothetical protein